MAGSGKIESRLRRETAMAQSSCPRHIRSRLVCRCERSRLLFVALSLVSGGARPACDEARTARRSGLMILGTAAVLCLAGAPKQTMATIGKVDGKTYLRSPLRFELNQGQADPRVKFLVRGSQYTAFLASD